MKPITLHPSSLLVGVALAGLVAASFAASCADGPSESSEATLFPALIHHGRGFQVYCAHGEKSVGLRFAEFDFATQSTYRSGISESTRFTVEAVLHRHGCEVYVLGRSSAAEYIVERWSIFPDSGAYATFRPEVQTPIGIPAALGTTTTFVVDGAFAVPTVRTDPVLQRDELFRSTQYPGTRCGAVDPEGRFLLLLTVDSQLVRIRLDGESTVEVIAEFSAIPFLASADSLDAYDHDSEGRKYLLMHDGALGDGLRLVLHDYDNDGEFELTELLDSAGWTSRDYDHHWISDFIHFTW